MPNYVLSKGATPMNQQFEITMFTSKFCVDSAMQNSFKVQSIQLDMTRYQFFSHFALKNDAHQNQCKLLMQTSIFQSTLHAKPFTLEQSCALKDKCAVNAEIFICNLLSGPLLKIIFEGLQIPIIL